jgi:hypothetical protein
MTNVNTTQSVGYVSFDDRDSASRFMERMTAPHFKLLVHLTRYGNFNNLKVLKHLRFGEDITFTKQELVEIEDLVSRVGY